MRAILHEPAPALYALRLDSAAAFAFCRTCGFVGVASDLGPQRLDWPRYVSAATARDGHVDSVVQAVHDLAEGSLVWMRDPAGESYCLAVVTGPWRYLHGRAARAADVHCVRAARILACERPERMPATITGRSDGETGLERIDDEVALHATTVVRDAARATRGLSATTLEDVLSERLDDDDLETLVCIYVQTRLGFHSFARSVRPDIGQEEYVVRNAERRQALVRARRGHAVVRCDDAALPPEPVDDVFAFSPTGTYGCELSDRVSLVDYGDIVEFICTERWSLPQAVEHWVSHALDGAFGDEGPARAIAGCAS